MRSSVPAHALATAILAAGSAACTDVLQPYGEAIVTVHTDMPVPQLIGAVRVDFYDDRGGWFESRDIATPSAGDWPLSFSVVSRDLVAGGRTLVRLRAYPAGRARDYHGERYQARPSFDPPWVPGSLAELCEEAGVLVPPQTVTLRRGKPLERLADQAITQPLPQDDCESTQHAATGVHVRIERSGRYCFEVLDTYPTMRAWAESDTTLFLRSRCAEPRSQLACNDDQGAPGTDQALLSRIAVTLEPGQYTLFLGSQAADPLADVFVRGALCSENEHESASLPELPRLVRNGVDMTPPTEPQPLVTVDRLIDTRLVPGEVQHTTVVLRGACAGTMAQLGETAPHQQVMVDQASTCVDRENELVRATDAPADDVEGAPAGAFAKTAACAAETNDADVVCVPGGALLLGDPHLSGHLPPRSALPERVARIDRFFIDRHEVTVARFRNALRAGLPAPGDDDLERNPYPLATSIWQSTSWSCSFSEEREDREDFGLSCISWEAARAFCLFEGGDLPTEAQWEHAASSAARPIEVLYPWEHREPAAPSCDRAVYGRLGDVQAVVQAQPNSFLELGSSVSGECSAQGFGPLPVDARSDSDVTPVLGIVGMAGGLAEWVRDAAYPYEHPCWRAAPLDDPACLMDEAPMRAVRGGSWVHGSLWLSGSSRGFKPARRQGHRPAGYIGFRCVYATPPAFTREAAP